MPDLKPYQPDPVIENSFPALVYALKRKYQINRAYVTREFPTNRLLGYLQQNYHVTGVAYRDLTNLEAVDSGQPDLSMLIVRDTRLDAFLLDIGGTSMVVIFFDDPNEFKALLEGDIQEVPPGNYSLTQTMQGYVLTPLHIGASDRPILEPGLMEGLQMDTTTFFDRADFYAENGIPHKRGVLVIGEPGVGKTSFTKYYLKSLHETYGIVIDCASIYFGPGLMAYLRSMFGNKRKVIAMEDVDGAVNGMSNRSAFLNFIDGPTELTNTLFVATTNYPERLDAAILDRPSRFDQIYYVGRPSLPLRREFLLKWFPDLSHEPDRLEALAVGTDGFTGAYFKELRTVQGLRDCSIEQALHLIHERQQLVQKFSAGNAYPSGEGPQEVMGMKLQSSPMPDCRIDATLAKKLLRA